MSYSLLRFGLALFLAGILALIIILMMKSFIDDYDALASDAMLRIFKLQTVSLTDEDYEALPYSEYSDEGLSESNSPEQVSISATDTQSEELQAILRKKKEIISILEEGP